MPDLFDTTQIEDELEHWDELAERVAATTTRESKPSGFDWLAHSRVGWVVASFLLVAAALAFMTLPGSGSAATTAGVEWTQILGPSDDAGSAIVFRERAPAVGALLLSGQGGNGR